MNIFKRGRRVVITPESRDDTRQFWLRSYSNWEEETFDVFEECADKYKTMIDIGSWVGPTVLYNAELFQQVIAVEADRDNVHELQQNIYLSGIQNITLIQKAVYHIPNTTVRFGKNEHIQGVDTSTQQIRESGGYEVGTITLDELIAPYDSVGLIKIDIEGGEENIINDILRIYLERGIKIYLSFHYSWWKNKETLFKLREVFQKCRTNLHHQNVVDYVLKNPFGSVLFY